MKLSREASLIHKAKVVHCSSADFLPSTQVVVKKQDSSFQNWEVSSISKKTNTW